MKQQGQTLIETVVGISILVMGISSAIGLASYAFGATSGVVKQLVGVGLAREGMEAVRNMRDTNWLQGSLSNGCWNYQTGASTGGCYTDWLSSFYDLAPGEYTLDFDPTATDDLRYWQLAGPGATDFRLYYAANPTSNGMYTTVASGNTFSQYFRKITISHDSNPYTSHDNSIGPRLRVKVQVWWIDKACPFSQNPDQVKAGCKVELDTYLTNWRNY